MRQPLLKQSEVDIIFQFDNNHGQSFFHHLIPKTPFIRASIHHHANVTFTVFRMAFIETIGSDICSRFMFRWICLVIHWIIPYINCPVNVHGPRDLLFVPVVDHLDLFGFRSKTFGSILFSYFQLRCIKPLRFWW